MTLHVGNQEIDRVSVIGAGSVGMSWAIVFARAGAQVRLYDADQQQFAGLRNRLKSSLGALEKCGAMTAADREACLRRVEYRADLDGALADTQYVQEAVPEDLALKQSVFEQLDRQLPPHVVIGSSTSALLMSQIATLTRHPDRCVVVHPTNPPHIVPLVEIVPGRQTSSEAVDFARDLMAAVGQSPIVCRKEIPGFIVNRLQLALAREAFYLAREGVASIEDIDRAVSDGLGLRWALIGPFLVEETNADNVRDDLTKYAATFKELFADVCRPYDGPSPDDIDRVEVGVRELMDGLTHDDLVAYRDELVPRIRNLKSHWRPDR